MLLNALGADCCGARRLADTDRRDRAWRRRGSEHQAVVLELLAQRAPVDTEDAGGARLVAARVIHNGSKQGQLDFTHDEFVEFHRRMAVEISEIVFQCLFSNIAQGFAIAECAHGLAVDRLLVDRHDPDDSTQFFILRLDRRSVAKHRSATNPT